MAKFWSFFIPTKHKTSNVGLNVESNLPEQTKLSNKNKFYWLSFPFLVRRRFFSIAAILMRCDTIFSLVVRIILPDGYCLIWNELKRSTIFRLSHFHPPTTDMFFLTSWLDYPLKRKIYLFIFHLPDCRPSVYCVNIKEVAFVGLVNVNRLILHCWVFCQVR